NRRTYAYAATTNLITVAPCLARTTVKRPIFVTHIASNPRALSFDIHERERAHKKIPRSKMLPREELKTSKALLRAIAPVVNLLLRLVLGVAVLRLELSFQLFPIAIDLGELIVGELAPLLFHLARERL